MISKFFLTRLQAQINSKGLFIYIFMQILIAFFCYKKQLNIMALALFIYLFLPFVLQIIFKNIVDKSFNKGITYVVYNNLYSVANAIQKRKKTLTLYILFYALIFYMVLDLVYKQQTVGIVIFIFIIIFQIILNLIILKLDKLK